jgi:hypothetical protein
MLKQYVSAVLEHTGVYRIALLSHAHLIGFYQACGFVFVRVSPVSHGKDTWFELALGEAGA